MKNIIQKFKNWLIKLLGGYTLEEVHKRGRNETDDLVKLHTAADVAPVVHGEWIIGVDNDDFDVKCSKCEWTDIFEVAGIFTVERIAKAINYCPNCGAKMDGGVNEC